MKVYNIDHLTLSPWEPSLIKLISIGNYMLLSVIWIKLHEEMAR